MLTEQGGSRNKLDVKRLCVYALFTAVCLVFGYIETLLPLDFIAPGVKLGLSNAGALLLAAKRDYKGAFLVNTARILLSALLFGSAVSLLFSLSAGIISLLLTVILSRVERFSLIGISIAAGAVHNAVQCGIAASTTGANTVYYLPVLLLFGALSGAVIGVISTVILKKIKTNGKK